MLTIDEPGSPTSYPNDAHHPATEGDTNHAEDVSFDTATHHQLGVIPWDTEAKKMNLPKIPPDLTLVHHSQHISLYHLCLLFLEESEPVELVNEWLIRMVRIVIVNSWLIMILTIGGWLIYISI